MSRNWSGADTRPLPMEKNPDTFRETMGDAYDEYIAFARDKELVLSGFQQN